MCHNRLFHYTDRKGSRNIQRQKRILQSTAPTNEAFGRGVYLTKRSPWHYSKAQIAKNNWGTSSTERVAYVVIVTFPDHEPKLRKESAGERDVWRYKGDLNLGDCCSVMYLFCNSFNFVYNSVSQPFLVHGTLNK